MGKLKEKDIVDYLIRNWDTYFKNEELYFYKKEYSVTDYWRADMLCYVWGPHPKAPDRQYKIPIFVEVKYNNNYRDLIYELEKGLEFINRKNHNPDFPQYLAVIVDDQIDPVSLEYIKKNNIPIYMYTIEEEDLTTLKLSMYAY